MYVSVDVDLDVESVYDSLSEHEKTEIIYFLREDGMLPSQEEDARLEEAIREAVYRLKYRGLDSEKTAVEILEVILEKADRT
jgi:DNA-binding transcriptional regulator YhcF (GntR family)